MEKPYSPPGKSAFCSYKQQSCLPRPGGCRRRRAFVWAHPGWTRARGHRETCPSWPTDPQHKQILCAPQSARAFILYSLACFGPFAVKYSSMKLPFSMRKRLHKSPSWGSTLQFFKTCLHHVCNFYIVLANISGHCCSMHESKEYHNLWENPHWSHMQVAPLSPITQ